MADVAFVVLVVGFFALAVGAVRLCEHIVGSELDGHAEVAEPPADAERVGR